MDKDIFDTDAGVFSKVAFGDNDVLLGDKDVPLNDVCLGDKDTLGEVDAFPNLDVPSDLGDTLDANPGDTLSAEPSDTLRADLGDNLSAIESLGDACPPGVFDVLGDARVTNVLGDTDDASG